jgi:hypothetical protein
VASSSNHAAAGTFAGRCPLAQAQLPPHSPRLDANGW